VVTTIKPLSTIYGCITSRQGVGKSYIQRVP
jgi:hypothetical protein